MPHDLILHEAAESELAEAFAWYVQRSPGLGDQFLLSVNALMSEIARGPLRFPEVMKGVRRALLQRFPFSVFFVVEDARVIVLAVFHAKRNPRAWQDRGTR